MAEVIEPVRQLVHRTTEDTLRSIRRSWMAVWRSLVPAEWMSAAASFAALRSVVRTDHGNLRREQVAFGLLFLAGAVAGFIVHNLVSANAVRGLLTVCGVLAGFTVTLMLFAGKVERAETIDYEEMRIYAAKVAYLLWSQLRSFGAHVATAMAAIGWLAAPHQVVSAVVFGFALVALVRSALLPLQVIELHKFSLEAMLLAKEKEINERVHIDPEMRRAAAEID